MNIGLGDPEPSFRPSPAYVRSASAVSRNLWHPVRVVKLVDTLRCERRAFGRAGSNPAAHKERFFDVVQRANEL